MPAASKELQRQMDQGTFDEILEVVRVFTVHRTSDNRTYRITIVRQYTEVSPTLDALYEQRDEQGLWHKKNFGPTLYSGNDEDRAIELAISFLPKSGGA